MSPALGFLAGLLSILSPCVLPLLPMVLGSAATAHRFGVAALAAGVVVAFVAAGLLVAGLGSAIDPDTLRTASAVLLGAIGLILLSTTLRNRFALATGGISNLGNRLSAGIAGNTFKGQFILGLLLGAVWSPCVGPTLGAASILAAQGRDLTGAAAVMFAFGLGAAVPLIVAGTLSRQAIRRWMQVGDIGKYILGTATLLVAVLILTGWDHALETVLLDHSPDWLTRLTTQY
jgi:cytochrome c biogenesis protein CcdA